MIMEAVKRILDSGRVRRVPTSGFSWVDRRFVRDHARALSRDGVLLYFFLAAVSDKNGLSFYGDGAIARILGCSVMGVSAARNELQHRNLIAYDSPLYQVLSLADAPDERAIQRECVRGLIKRLQTRGGVA